MKVLGEIKIDEEHTVTTGEVVRKTKRPLDKSFGRDKDKPLVVELRDGDLLILRPHRCRLGAVTLSLHDLYRRAILSANTKRR